MNRPPSHRHRRGAALIVTLAFIFMISTVVVALAISMRQDRPAANLHLERARADFLAQDGVERVIATLRQMCADPARNWMTQPGQLVVGAELDPAVDPTTMKGDRVDPRKVLQYVVPLHSGVAAATTPAAPADAVARSLANPPNLNLPTLRNAGTPLITDDLGAGGGTAPAMPVKWIGVLQDGTLSSVLTATDAAPNRVYTWADNPDYRTRHANGVPVVGRYAYWVDDESGKLNYNLAWGRTRTGNTNPPSHPTALELTVLPGVATSMADALHNFAATGGRFFNTPEDARQLETSNAGITAALQTNKFQVTQYSHDPNTTFFNNQRIVLTTRPERAGWTYDPTKSAWVGVNGLTWENGGLPRYLRVLKSPELKMGSQVQTPDYIPSASANDPIDPGLAYAGSIDYTRLSQTLYDLVLRPSSVASKNLPVGYLQRQDWPMVTTATNVTASIQKKYYGSYPSNVGSNGVSLQTSRLVELALNLIEYVRAKESPQKLITPLAGKYDPTAAGDSTWFYSSNNASTNTYLGISRGIYINEIAASLERAAADINPPGGIPIGGPKPGSSYPLGQTYYSFRIELYLPKNYGVDQFDLTKLYLTVNAPQITGVGSGTNPQTNSYAARAIDASEISNPSNAASPTFIKAGTYAVITQKIALYNYDGHDKGANSPPLYYYDANRPTSINVRIALGLGAASSNLDISPASPGQVIPLAIGPVGSTIDGATSMEVNDPRVNKSKFDWQACTNAAKNSFGDVNSSCLASLGQPAPTTVVPQMDTDASGKVSDASFYMPAPAGTVVGNNDNTKGRVLSAAELGYLHTGIEPCSAVSDGSTTINLTTGGVPWRSLRLQPNTQDTSVVPDWAVMDLFTAPVAPPDDDNRYVYAPHGTSFGGRINVNSAAQPFTGLQRVLPLQALLLNCKKTSDATATLSSSEASQLAQHIYNRDLASNGKKYGGAYSDGYVSPGQIVEVQGIADGGEASEELVRQMGNLVTTRGDVFSVYTVGQALKETPSGQIVVMGEQRVQAMVERYLDTTVDPPVVHFAPVYYRNLVP